MIKPDKMHQKEKKKISVRISESNHSNKDFRSEILEREVNLIQMSPAFISAFPTQAFADSQQRAIEVQQKEMTWSYSSFDSMRGKELQFFCAKTVGT